MSYPSKTEFDNLRNSLPLTYQTRGNYAFRTDLARNINTALTNVNTALAYYAKKTDIPVVPTNVVTKTDLAGYALRSEIPVVPSNVASKSDLASYALASDLTKYQPAGRYVSPSELEAYQPKGDYAVTKDLVSYAKSSDLASYQPKGDYAVKSDFANYQPKGDYAVKSDFANYQPKGEYALAKDLDSYAKSSDLANYQPTGNYALKTDLVNYTNKATANVFAAQQTFNGGIILGANSSSDLLGKVNIPNATVGNLNVNNIKAASIDGYAKTSDLASYALKTELDSYAKSSNLANFQPKGDYALASNLANYQPKGDYAVKSDFANYQPKGDYAVKSDLANYALTGAANTFNAQQTFNGGINLGLNSSSNLLGKVNISNATVGNLNVTTIKAASIDGYAKTSDLDSYALKTQLANYALTGAANTFNAQQTFNQNATVKTGANTPFQVTGEGGLRVTGNATISGNQTVNGNVDIVNPTPRLVVRTSDNTDGQIYFGNSNHGVGRNPSMSTLKDGNDVGLWTAGTGSLGFVTSGVERMRVSSSGDLNVAGTANFGGSQNVTGNSNVGGQLKVGGDVYFKNNGDGGKIMFHDEHHAIYGRLPYEKDGGVDKMQFREYGDIEFWTGGLLDKQSKRMTIAANGDVIVNGSQNVTGNSNVGNQTVNGGDLTGIQTPNGNLKINKNGIMLGGNNNGKEANSAQISAGIHVPNSLNIVGMSSGPGSGDRKIDAWAEGGFTIHGGQLNVGSQNVGSQNVGSQNVTGNSKVGGQLNVSSIKIGRWTITGGNDLEIKGDNNRPSYKFAINNDGNFVAKTSDYGRNF